jgi:hypothetical protein
VIDDVFRHILRAPELLEFTVRIAYFEIYMERIRDLLGLNTSGEACAGSARCSRSLIARAQTIPCPLERIRLKAYMCAA